MPRMKYVSQDDALDLLSTINQDSNVSVYTQLENLIHFGIASGQLKAGDRLPPARELADRLQINMNTVSKAYRDLVVMGLLTTRRGLGVFVHEGAVSKCRAHCRTTIVRHLFEAVAESKAAGFSADEVREIVQKVLDARTAPYGAVPDSLAAYLS